VDDFVFQFDDILPTPEMLANLDRMRVAVEEYLIKEGLLGDASYCEIEKWRARGEEYLTDSLLVLLIDSSPFHTIMNFGGDQPAGRASRLTPKC